MKVVVDEPVGSVDEANVRVSFGFHKRPQGHILLLIRFIGLGKDDSELVAVKIQRLQCAEFRPLDVERVEIEECLFAYHVQEDVAQGSAFHNHRIGNGFGCPPSLLKVFGRKFKEASDGTGLPAHPVQVLLFAADTSMHSGNFVWSVLLQVFVSFWRCLHQNSFPIQPLVEYIRVAEFFPVKSAHLKVLATAHIAKPLQECFVLFRLRHVPFILQFALASLGRCLGDDPLRVRWTTQRKIC
mmetsp:Transcript_24888/g.69865  ORF Transcript_24888/g.69865 Transcript_24888/m.69865 type:complete len:241 (+) Transcript_24888:161-883(+)